MHIITLLTDWQNNDYYKAVVKAKLLSQVSDVHLVDISHSVDSFHISQAAFLLSSAIYQFPKGSIHLFGIQTTDLENTKVIVAHFKGQYIIANDNGIFDVLNLDFDEIIEVDKPYSHFPMAENFIPIAVDIIRKKKLLDIGNKISDTKKYLTIQASVEDNMIVCPVNYIDSYGNILVDLRADLFEKERKGRRFEIVINSRKYRTNEIHKRYEDVPKSEIFSIFNSAGWLEIGMRMANISKILNLSEQTNIMIKFYDD